MTSFEGTFSNFKNENLDEYFSGIGIPWIARKMMTTTSPTIEISKTDDKWTIKTTSLLKTSSVTFALGEEYEETMGGGRTIKNVTTLDGNKMITDGQSDRGKSKRVMELDQDGFLLTLTHEKTDVVAKRYFRRL